MPQQFTPLEAAPESLRKPQRIAADAVLLEVFAHSQDIPVEPVEGIAVCPGLHRLREIDDLNSSVPVEDIERRQVAVDPVSR